MTGPINKQYLQSFIWETVQHLSYHSELLRAMPKKEAVLKGKGINMLIGPFRR